MEASSENLKLLLFYLKQRPHRLWNPDSGCVCFWGEQREKDPRGIQIERSSHEEAQSSKAIEENRNL